MLKVGKELEFKNLAILEPLVFLWQPPLWQQAVIPLLMTNDPIWATNKRKFGTRPSSDDPVIMPIVHLEVCVRPASD